MRRIGKPIDIGDTRKRDIENMRKVTQQIEKAWKQGKSKTVGNTRTDGTSVWLHGNKIIERDPDGRVWATLAYWPTPTTRERLKIVSNGFYQKNHEQFFNDRPIEDNEWVEIA